MRRVSPSLIREVNHASILRLIGREGPIARHEIARRLRLSPATVTAATRALIAGGLVRVVDQAASSGGRPALLLGLVPSAAHALGVKIAADHLVGVRVSLDGDVVERFEERFDAAAPSVVGDLVAALRRWTSSRREGGVEEGSVLLGVGVGVPGVVDVAGGGRVDSPMLGWRQLALGDLLQRELDVPVLVDNDVNTLAIAERLYGRGRDVEDFLTVTIGRGVGLGIVLGGDVYRGARGGAGEFGHVPVAADGPRCECGKRGCLEALVADPALAEQARDEGVIGRGDGIEAVRAKADAGDANARAIYGRAGATLGRSVAALVNVLSPELVLVSGEGTQAWVHLARAFEEELHAAVFPPLGPIAVEVDPWDDAKWAHGAAALVLRATFVAGLPERELASSARVRLGASRSGEAGAP